MSGHMMGSVVSIVAACGTAAASVSVFVSAQANPYFAGEADGTTAGNDSLPDQSPVLVEIDGLVPGGFLAFEADGLGSKGPFEEAGQTGPDGFSEIVGHSAGALFGKSDFLLPLTSLIGVFLSDDVPSEAGATPDALDFSSAESRDFGVLSPEVAQIFFIGDGFSSAGDQHLFEIPRGATRLFLAVSDGFDWFNNEGGFDVTVTIVPAPAGMGVAAVAGLFAARRRRAD